MRTTLASFVLATLIASPAVATPISYTLSGTVTSTYGSSLTPLSTSLPGIAVGTPITGSLSYDPDAAGPFPWQATVDLELFVSAYTITASWPHGTVGSVWWSGFYMFGISPFNQDVIPDWLTLTWGGTAPALVTVGIVTFSEQQQGKGFTASFTQTPTTVPDAGSPALLLMMGVVAILSSRRRDSAVTATRQQGGGSRATTR